MSFNDSHDDLLMKRGLAFQLERMNPPAAAPAKAREEAPPAPRRSAGAQPRRRPRGSFTPAVNRPIGISPDPLAEFRKFRVFI